MGCGVWTCGMRALLLVKNDDYGYAKSQNKSFFAVFVFCKKTKKAHVPGSALRSHNLERASATELQAPQGTSKQTKECRGF